MHSAPAVSYPVGRVREVSWAVWLILAISAGGIWAWRYQTDSNGWRLVLLLGAQAIAAIGAGWSAARTTAGELRWDGEQWSLSTAPPAIHAVAAQVTLDLQRLLLVRLAQPGQGRAVVGWCWLVQRSAPAQWAALRRALYARPTRSSAPNAQDVGAATAAIANDGVGGRSSA